MMTMMMMIDDEKKKYKKVAKNGKGYSKSFPQFYHYITDFDIILYVSFNNQPLGHKSDHS